jgi:hypothetical protein
MIAANKRFITATLTEGVLAIQSNLIELYTSNLTAVATQAALIAGFTFAVITQPDATNWDSMSDSTYTMAYIYTISYTLCLITSLCVLSQSTIVVMFGPSKALKGDNEDHVKQAADNMRKYQKHILKLAFASISALFCGSVAFQFAHAPIYLAGVSALLFLIGFIMLVYYGLKAFDDFKLDDDITYDKRKLSKETEVQSTNLSGDALTITGRLKFKGILWRRSALESGGIYTRQFGVIDKGQLDLFKDEGSYMNHENPLNSRPYKLWHYILETDHRKYERQVTSLRNMVKRGITGNGDFDLKDLTSKKYDLVTASKEFKFALIPKVQTELVSQETIELLAHDRDTYAAWTTTFEGILLALDDEGKPTLTNTVRSGTRDLETAVRAANAPTVSH